MSRRANEAKMVFPAHWHGQVLGCEVVTAVGLASTDHDQWKHREEMLPDGMFGVEVDQALWLGFFHTELPDAVIIKNSTPRQRS